MSKDIPKILSDVIYRLRIILELTRHYNRTDNFLLTKISN